MSCFSIDSQGKCWINEMLTMSQCLLKMFPVWLEHKLKIIFAPHRSVVPVLQIFFSSLSKLFIFWFFSGNSVLSFRGQQPFSRQIFTSSLSSPLSTISVFSKFSSLLQFCLWLYELSAVNEKCLTGMGIEEVSK